MTKFFPEREANNITKVLRATGVVGLPVDVMTVASEISKAKYPDEPITVIKGIQLSGFEGALSRAPSGKIGWGIFYNSAVNSRGRINFTLAHEFGHYILHRKAYPTGFECNTEDMAKWDSEYSQRENEANVFAATLLMPLDDFRDQIDPSVRVTFDDLKHCVERYDVSLIASTLRWLQYTTRLSVLIVSRDGFILWARSSKKALRSGLYFKTRNQAAIAVPVESLAAKPSSFKGIASSCEFQKDSWFNLPCTEHAILSAQYDFTLSLVHFHEAI